MGLEAVREVQVHGAAEALENVEGNGPCKLVSSSAAPNVNKDCSHDMRHLVLGHGPRCCLVPFEVKPWMTRRSKIFHGASAIRGS